MSNQIKIKLDIPNDVVYPTMAAVPFEKGQVFPDSLISDWQLFRRPGHPQHSYKKIVACWPDGSVKWAQIYAVYKGGSYVLQYSLQKPQQVLQSIPEDYRLKWILEIEDGDGNIWTNRPVDRTANELTEISAEAHGLSLISREGGWESGGSSETKMVEIDDPVLRKTRYEGYYRLQGSQGAEPQFRYCTRITCYAERPNIIKVENSCLFASSMRDKKIKRISFNIPVEADISVVHYGVDGMDHMTPLALNGQIQIHQRKPKLCEITVDNVLSGQDTLRSDGYLGCNHTTLYSRNFWQKFPQQLSYSENYLTYSQWFGKKIVFTDQDENGLIESLWPENLSRMLWCHEGECLENNPPKDGQGLNGQWADRFYALMRGDEGDQEEDISYTDRVDMEGISIYDEFAICTGSQDRTKFSELWQRNPVGRCDASVIEETKVVDFAARRSDFPELEQFLEDSILGYTNPERFNDYGRFIFGESHRTILPLDKRCSFTRWGLNCYYSSGESTWMMVMRGWSNDLLQKARAMTERYNCIGTVNYNKEFTAGGGPVNPDHEVASTWYRGLWWGDGGDNTAIPGIDNHGFYGRIGRFPDPDTHFYSWMLDGNWNSKDAYERWYAFTNGVFTRTVDTVNATNYRGIVKQLVYAITAFDHFYKHPQPLWQISDQNKELMMKYFIHYTSGLMSFRMDKAGLNSSLFHPLWISRAIDLFNDYLPDGNQKEEMISNLLSFVISNYNSNFLKGARTLDMAVIMWEVANNRFPFYANHLPQEANGVPYPEFLLIIRSQIKEWDHITWIQKMKGKILSKDENNPWFHFGIGDFELGDCHLKFQLGRFLKLLRALNLTESDFPAYSYPGMYPSSAQSKTFQPKTIKWANGNEILVLNEDNQPLHFNIKTSPNGYNNAGAYNQRELWIVSPLRNIQNRAIHNRDRKTGTHFMCLTNDADRTEDNYVVNSIPQRLQDLQSQGYFDSYTPPICVEKFKPNWDQSNIFLSPGGTEDFTAQYSYFPTPQDIPGIYRLLVDGKNVYSGIVSNPLPEAMHLIPNYMSSGASGSAWNYIFSDSHFYLKNLSDSDNHLNFWASVEPPYTSDSGRSTAGCFARIVHKDHLGNLIKWDEIQFQDDDAGYGHHDDGTDADYNFSNVKITLSPGQIIQLDITLIYEATVVRMELEDHLLCARTLQEIEAFDAYKDDIITDPWTRPAG